MAAAIVTNPIHKAVLQAAGFPHPGHTEFLGELANCAEPPVMMLACRKLRVVPVTVHLPLHAVAPSLRIEDIVRCARITHRALQQDFGIAKPRLAITGLNPHAGEEGSLGCEDRTIIRPAIEILCATGIDATGPHAADALFHRAARRRYDAALGMCHDQALIPVKTLDFDGTVNVTLGLPFVRTSPDHGTALDIAGKGLARATSLIAALDLAADLVLRRTAAQEQQTDTSATHASNATR